MPEYFSLSFIEQKNCQKGKKIDQLFTEKYRLKLMADQRENYLQQSQFKILETPGLLFYIIDEQEGEDFIEYTLAFPEIHFHKETFEQELQLYTELIEDCFKECPCLEFVLCGFELSFGDFLKLKDFDEKFLSQFPIVYKRQEGNSPKLMLNFHAQDIF